MSNEVIIYLPRLVGSRLTMQRILEAFVPFAGKKVTVNARDLRSASPSSVDELVRFTLVDENARFLEVLGASAEVSKDLEQAAATHGVKSRMHELSLS